MLFTHASLLVLLFIVVCCSSALKSVKREVVLQHVADQLRMEAELRARNEAALRQQLEILRMEKAAAAAAADERKRARKARRKERRKKREEEKLRRRRDRLEQGRVCSLESRHRVHASNIALNRIVPVPVPVNFEEFHCKPANSREKSSTLIAV